MKHLDLFSGIGGFALAAKWAEIETVKFVEIDKFCQKVLAKNFPNVSIHDDIKTFKGINVDLITAGFPCQPFSVAGKRKGIDDDRYLWPETLRVIRKSKPTWFIGENVTGLVAMELDNILTDLESEDYETRSYIIPACAANAPHRRDRVWIIANRLSKRCNMWSDTGKERHLQAHKEWNIAALQSEWEKLKPESWQTFNAEKWLSSHAASFGQSTERELVKPMHSEKINQRKTINVINDNNQTEKEPHKPPISGMDDGIPNGLDRNKSLGNAIVPQVAYVFLKLIKLFENKQ